MRGFLFIVCAMSLGVSVYSQRTVGIMLNDTASFNGYTLFSPAAYEWTYLIDNCGDVVNAWESLYRPGLMSYLTDDGDLVRAARIGSTFPGGGAGGRIERFDWDGNLEWAIDYSTLQYHQHHDIEILPNGNILILAWELRTAAEARAAGRDTNQIPEQGVWSERVVEIRPVGSGDFDVVWSWHLWDHLVQDYDSLAENFGAISTHPERIDINYPSLPSRDWIHANSLDYNPELDQIMIGTRNFEELWVIDHSTTTAEAATGSGGNSGKGGDILYRWGNPEAYGRGTSADKKFFLQHDCKWIPDGLPGAGQIMIFNNGVGRPGGGRSSVDIIAPPPIDASGSYIIESDHPFGPDTLLWTYDGGDEAPFFSQRISGADRLPNGNTLICIGVDGRFVEIDSAGQQVWEYLSPIGIGGPVDQGDSPPLNDVFRVVRYEPSFPGLADKTLVNLGPIEFDTTGHECSLSTDTITSATQHPAHRLTFRVFPNPVRSFVNVESDPTYACNYVLRDPNGGVLQSGVLIGDVTTIEMSTLAPGMYFLSIWNKAGTLQHTAKVIKI